MNSREEIERFSVLGADGGTYVVIIEQEIIETRTTFGLHRVEGHKRARTSANETVDIAEDGAFLIHTLRGRIRGTGPVRAARV